MMHKRKLSYTTGEGERHSTEVTISGDSELAIDADAIPAGQEVRKAVTIDFAQVRAMYVLATQPATISVNDSKTGSPTATITLREANAPFVWSVNDAFDPPVSGTINDLYISNDGALEGSVKVRFLLAVAV